MRPQSFAFVLLGLAFFVPPAMAGSASGEPAWEIEKSLPGQAFRDPGYPSASLAQRRWAALPASALESLRKTNAMAGNKALRIGIERPLADGSAGELADLDWRAAPDGGQTARIALQSPGAAALRVALRLTGLPAGSELRFAAPGVDRSVVDVVSAGEIEALAVQQPLYWTPVTDGDTQAIEIWLPPGASARWLRVAAPAVSHLVVSPTGDLSGAKIGESDVCEIDTKCVTNPSTAYINARNAVARMVFQSGGGSSLCTGTLLNDTDNATQVPYFFGAAHCFTSQAEGNTLTTFWFYESTGCGTNVLDPGARQVGGGAQVLFASVASDVLFLRLNSAPPAGSYFLGWNSAQVTAGTEFVAIHHPAGDVKKVSLGQVTGIGPSNLASGSFIKAGYTDGTTEGGSSGCGLLTASNGEFVLRGGLLGGGASCANTGSINNPNNSDDYSRLDLAFPNLRQFLQPSSNPPPPAGTDFTGLWFNPAQSGWGLVVMRGASGAYSVTIFHYDVDSSPVWYLAAGAINGASFNQPVSAFTGPWFGITPFNPGLVAGRTAGSVSLNFTSTTTASLAFTVDGRSVATELTKLAF